MSDYFSWEIITEIFSHLPSKSLMRFKCVSKDTRSLIEDRSFIKFHLNKSRQSGNNFKLVFLEGIEQPLIHSGDLNSINVNGIQETFSLPLLKSFSLIVGCCDSMICYLDKDANIFIVNVSTREHRIVDTKPEKNEHPYGFGYDSINDDYKILFFRQVPYNCQPRLYSLKNHTWGNIAPLKYIGYYGSAISFAGNLVLLGDRNGCDLILGFDLGTDTSHEFDLPDALTKQKDLYALKLSVLQGLLCVTWTNRCRCEIWVMEEYKVKNTWTNRFSITPWAHLSPVSHYNNKSDEILLEEGSGLLYWYDTITTERWLVETLQDKFESRYGNVVGVFLQSLFLA